MALQVSSVEGNLMKSGETQRNWNPFQIFVIDIWSAVKPDKLGIEIAQLAFPAALALTADPLASLIDTAFIGKIGATELAAVGISIAVFNQVSKVFNFPLVSVTTSLVAEENATIKSSCPDSASDIPLMDVEADNKEEEIPFVTGNQKSVLPSVSSTLVLGTILGIVEALILIAGAEPILGIMGVHADSPMKMHAEWYLRLRAIGAPAVVLSLAIQGVFRGFKDATTPLYATVAGNISNMTLDPILIFYFKLGVNGAAIAHTVSQYFAVAILLWKLRQHVVLLPQKLTDLKFELFFKNGFLLMCRVMAATFTVTLAASMAARLGTVPMAAFQICLQIWLATSLLADALALAGQAILATAFAQSNYEKVKNTTARILQMGFILGISLATVLGGSLGFVSRLFTKDIQVLRMINIGIPFVAATQPLNTLAFVFDGVNYGASDFKYAAVSMICVSIIAVLCLLVISHPWGFTGIWISLTIMMALRMVAGVWRIATATGPWKFLKK